MVMDRSKLSKWITVPVEPGKKCGICPKWNLCHNRSCPAKIFNTAGTHNENCGYENKSIDYVLRFLDKSGSNHIKVYDGNKNG
jgi:hypothetical protein